MSFQVGIPCMKCSLNPSKAKNAKTGKTSKTCSVSSAWREMNDERLGRDQTIDRSLTAKNVWMVGSSETDIVGLVQDKIDEINAERKELGVRSLRSDAVSVLEIIEKPPLQHMETLSYEEKQTFLRDSHETMQQLLKEWNPEWTVVASVQHHDEFGGLSAHNHSLVLLSTHDKNGVPSMRAKDEAGLPFYNFINSNYPARMREKGYDIADCKMYEQMTDEEKLERKLNPPERGLDAVTYKQKKYEETKELQQQLEAREESIKAITGAPSLKSYQTLKDENEKLKEDIRLKDKIIDSLRAANEKLQDGLDRMRKELDETKNKIKEISQRAGRRLMGFLGHPVNDPSIQEFPSKSVSEGIKEMTDGVKHSDPRKYRVVPEEGGQYQIVEPDTGDKYRQVKGGFPTREAADLFRRSAFEIKKGIDQSVDDGMKGGMN